MPKKYELTPQADNDLGETWLYTAETWGKEQADEYVAMLHQRFEALAETPYMGPERPDIAEGCRYFPEEKHLIIYRAEDDKVVILAVPHASMDIDKHLEQAKEQERQRTKNKGHER